MGEVRLIPAGGNVAMLAMGEPYYARFMFEAFNVVKMHIVM